MPRVQPGPPEGVVLHRLQPAALREDDLPQPPAVPEGVRLYHPDAGGNLHALHLGTGEPEAPDLGQTGWKSDDFLLAELLKGQVDDPLLRLDFQHLGTRYQVLRCGVRAVFTNLYRCQLTVPKRIVLDLDRRARDSHLAYNTVLEGATTLIWFLSETWQFRVWKSILSLLSPEPRQSVVQPNKL